jgi:glycosyltransferase involved in cell wall biosynthesis
MRILHLIHRYPPAMGGSEYFMQQASEFLVRKGHTVTVHTTAAKELDHFWRRDAQSFGAGAELLNGVRVVRHRLSQFPLQRQILRVLSMAPVAVWQCMTQHCNPPAAGLVREAFRPRMEADIVHALCAPYSLIMYCAARIATAIGAPLVLSPNLHLGDLEDPHDKTRKIYFGRPTRYLLSRADLVFAQTEIEKEQIARVGIDPAKVEVMGNGVWPDECGVGDREAARRSWGIGNGEVVIGHLANKSREKGTVDLLIAAERLWDQGHKFSVVLAGPEMPNFREFWSRYASQDRTVRLGVVSESEKRDFYAGIDLFCMPSMSDSFGIVFLESWANDKPVIAYRSGGVPAVVRHEIDGLLASPHNIGELTTAIERLVSDGHLRARFAEAGRSRTLSEFTWERRLERLEKAYFRILGNQSD